MDFRKRVNSLKTSDYVKIFRRQGASNVDDILVDIAVLSEFIRQGIPPTPAGSLLLKTNGIDNAVQNILNLVAGTGISITSDLLGNVTIAVTGSGGTYTVNNGLIENPVGNFQLGGQTLGTGNLIRNTYITNDGYIFRIDQTTGIGLDVRNVTGTAVQALTSLGYAIRASSQSGIGIEGISVDQEAGLFIRNSPDFSSIIPVVKIQRNTDGTALAGMGAAIDVWLEPRITTPAPSPTVPTGSFQVEWLVPGSAASARRGQFNITLDKGDAQTRVMHGNANGEMFLDDYGVGNHVDTPTYALGVNAAGKQVEFPVPSGGSVLTDDSIQGDGTSGNEVKLVNDAATPGVNKVYGTDNAGNRGWRNELIYPAGAIPGTVVGTFPAKRNQFGFEIISSVDRIYIPGNTDNIVEIYEASSGDYLGFLSITSAYSVIYVSSINEVWITNSVNTTITRVDPATFTVLGTFASGGISGYTYVEISPTKIYVANWASNSISEIDPTSFTVVATVTAATLGVTNIRYIDYVSNPLSFHYQYLVGVCPTSSRFYALDTTTNTVAISGTNFGGTLGSPPNGIAYNSIEDKYYVTFGTASQVRIFEPTSISVATFLNRKHANNAIDILFDAVTQKVYVSCFVQMVSGSGNSINFIQCIDEDNLYWTIMTPTSNVEGTFYRNRLRIDSTNGYVYTSAAFTLTSTTTLSKIKI